MPLACNFGEYGDVRNNNISIAGNAKIGQNSEDVICKSYRMQ